MAFVATDEGWVSAPLTCSLVLHVELASVAIVHLPFALIEILNAGRVG